MSASSTRGARVAAMALGAALALPALADTYADSFDSGVIDPWFWTVQLTDGSTLAAVNQRLEAVQGSGPTVGGGAQLRFNFEISGDFTASIDFVLLNWPANNFERVGISTGPDYVIPLGAVARVSDAAYPFDEFYASFFSGTSGPPYPQAFVESTDVAGRLKLERVGQTMTGSFWNGSGWTAIGSHSEASQSVPINTLTFGMWDYLQDTPGVRVAFDNFELVAPGSVFPPVPEAPTWTLLAAGLAGLGLQRRRRPHRVCSAAESPSSGNTAGS